MNKTLIKLLAVAGVVAGLAACGNGNNVAANAVPVGPVDSVANIETGSQQKFDQWVDQGGLAKYQNNLLGRTRVQEINVTYMKPEFGGGVLEAYFRVYGTPEETREATASLCNTTADQFIVGYDPVANGVTPAFRANREYVCRYENTQGRGYIIITSKQPTDLNN